MIPVLYTYGSAHVPLRALRKESTPAPRPPLWLTGLTGLGYINMLNLRPV